MIPLAEKYSKNSYNFELVKREGDVAIYKQTDPDSGKFVAFEVFEVIKRKETVLGGKLIEAREACPSNEAWGQQGFTVGSILEAEAKVGLLQEKLRNRSLAKRVVQ